MFKDDDLLNTMIKSPLNTLWVVGGAWKEGHERHLCTLTTVAHFMTA